MIHYTNSLTYLLTYLQNASADLRHGRRRSLGCVRVVEPVWFEDVELSKVGSREVTIDLVLVNDALRQRLLRYLPLVNLLLHCALRNKPVIIIISSLWHSG